MAYADLTYYKTTYGGRSVVDDETTKWLERASDDLDMMTGFQIASRPRRFGNTQVKKRAALRLSSTSRTEKRITPTRCSLRVSGSSRTPEDSFQDLQGPTLSPRAMKIPFSNWLDVRRRFSCGGAVCRLARYLESLLPHTATLKKVTGVDARGKPTYA